MKCLALLWTVIAVTAADADVLSLEAHELGAGDAQISNWETNYGSYDRDFARSKKILVTLHNVSRKPAPFAITVYFIAKPAVPPGSAGYDPRTLFVYDRREHASEFQQELELRGAFSSRTVGANVTHYQALGVESASGSDMIGWIVVGYSKGHRFGVAASSQELLQLAEGNGRQSFEEMIAEYQKDHPSTLTAAGTHFSEPASQTSADAAQTSSPVVPQRQKQAAEFITLIKAIEMPVAYGKTRLPAGTRLQVVSHTSAGVNARYMGDTVLVPLDAIEPK